MFEGILVVGFSLKVEIYTSSAYVPFFTFGEFAGTHQSFVGMSAGAYRMEEHRLHSTTKMDLFLVTCSKMAGSHVLLSSEFENSLKIPRLATNFK
jgi:hypothetical protein